MNKKTGQMNKNMDKEEGKPARASETIFEDSKQWKLMLSLLDLIKNYKIIYNWTKKNVIYNILFFKVKTNGTKKHMQQG